MKGKAVCHGERVEVNRVIEHLHAHLGDKVSVETLADRKTDAAVKILPS